MGLLDRLRARLSGLFGSGDSATDASADAGNAAADRLDPDNVTEVRTKATDDSVTKLRDVKQRSDDADRNGHDDRSSDGSARS